MSSKKTITTLLTFVVLFNEAQPAGLQHHICKSSDYEAAKDQPGYNWEPVHTSKDENECLQFIEDHREELEAGNDYEKMTNKQLIAVLLDKFEIEAEAGTKKADLLKMIAEAEAK